MVRDIPICMGEYDFDKIAEFAYKRFIKGIDTVSLLAGAQSEREKEEVILISLLNVSDAKVTALELSCHHANACRITDCRQKLRGKLEQGFMTKGYCCAPGDVFQ